MKRLEFIKNMLIVIGLLIIFGAVGADDVAMSNGVVPSIGIMIEKIVIGAIMVFAGVEIKDGISRNRTDRAVRKEHDKHGAV